MAAWEYKVAYVDFRGRISSEGSEFIRQPGEHRTAFVRRYLDALGQEGWEVAALQPLLIGFCFSPMRASARCTLCQV